MKTDRDQNPLDPNYEKRRSSLGSMEDQQQDQSNVKQEDIMVDREVAPCVKTTTSQVFLEVYPVTNRFK